jgi:hypothetical protein
MKESVTSNTRECFRTFIGQRLIGLLFNALPLGHRDLAAGTKTLVFEDGRGLTIGGNGSYWVDSADEIQRAVDERRQELNMTRGEIAEVLALAGALTVKD